MTNFVQADSTAAFVMPFWASDEDYNQKFIEEAIDSIFKQTDPNWHLIIVNDKATSSRALEYLENLSNNKKISIIHNLQNSGPGESRNIGIQYAFKEQYPIVLFNDADDCSHENRLEITRDIFIDKPEVSVVYSTFQLINEVSEKIPSSSASASITEILDSHEFEPPVGKNAWIDIGIRTGYTNLTSSTSVLTTLAYHNPFPKLSIAEDAYAWLIYSAAGNDFFYTPEIPSLYRIPTGVAGSSSRDREGGVEKFIEQGVQNLTDGFTAALNIAIKLNKISAEIQDELLVKFYIRMAVTLDKECLNAIAVKQLNIAKEKSEHVFNEVIKNYDYDFSKYPTSSTQAE